ncbi:hypothetical protein KJ865_14675, partial [Myxococcota bacterium]|nr:hypothetical protein [Myxococcota bacterium]
MKKTPETTAPENPAAPAETPVKSPSENSTGNSTEKPLENSTGNWASVPSSTEGKTFTLVIYRSS